MVMDQMQAVDMGYEIGVKLLTIQVLTLLWILLFGWRIAV